MLGGMLSPRRNRGYCCRKERIQLGSFVCAVVWEEELLILKLLLLLNRLLLLLLLNRLLLLLNRLLLLLLRLWRHIGELLMDATSNGSSRNR